MGNRQPKKYIRPINYSDIPFGKDARINYTKVILNHAPIIPKPLEYEDIDNCFFEFVDKEIDILINGNKIPTFTLYSSQRFSEYSQTWSYTDEDNNLLMNFKTVNRDTNPGFGDNQGGLWNIPGNRKYTLLQRTVLEDNGEESYEIYSMRQPYSVDMSYRVNFVTNNFENLNLFNQKINDLFKSRQHYIRPNGHYIPMVVDEINDESVYSIEDRKFYVQSITIKIMAYIIHEDDFQVEKFPKRIILAMEGEKSNKPRIVLDEYEEENIEYTAIDMTIEFKAWDEKVKFISDTDFVVNKVSVENIRNIRVFINGSLLYHQDGFKIKNNDEIKIRIFPIDYRDKSTLILHGYNPNKKIDKQNIPDFVFRETPNIEDVKID